MNNKEEVKKMLTYLISNTETLSKNIKLELIKFLKTNHITKDKYQEQNPFISNLKNLLSSINQGNTISDTKFNELRTFFSNFFKENNIDMEGNTLKSPRIQKTKSPSPPSLSPSSSPSLSPSLYDNLDEDEIIVRFDGKKVIYNKKKDKEAIQKPKSPSPPSLSPSSSPSSSPSLSPSLYDNLDKDEIIVRINGKKVIYNKKKDKEAIKKPKSPPLSSSRGGQKKNVIRIRRIKKY